MYSRIIPGRLDRRSSGRRVAAFDGDFADLFPGAYQVMQSDRGLTYGGTVVPVASNTSTTALTLTGSLATAPVPIWVVATNSAVVGAGATFDVYLDGLGVTPLLSGVAPTAGSPIPLNGAGAGLSLTWSAGTGVLTDSWIASGAASADQSGNAKHYVKVGATLQPTIAFLDTRAVLSFDASRNQNYGSTLALPAPLGASRTLYAVFRVRANMGGQAIYCGSSTSVHSIITQTGLLNDVKEYNAGSFANNVAGRALNTWYRMIATFTGSTADFLKIGSASATGQNAGNNAITDYFLGGAGVFPSNVDFALLAWLPGATQSFPAADAAVTTYYNGLVSL